MLCEFSIFPVDKGIHLSEHVARAVRLIEESGLPHRVYPMGTVIEGSWEDIMALIKKCHEAIARDSDRVVVNIHIDDRKGAKDRLTGKIASVEAKLGHEVRK